MNEERLWEHYGNALEEYRFQVNLNWSRSQYFFVLNAAILAAGIGLLSAAEKVPAAVAVAVFFIGAVSSIVSMLANRTQHAYYENARDRKAALEQRLALEDLALATTPGMGGARDRIARVGTLQTLMLSGLLAADLTGFGVAMADAVESEPAPKVRVVTRVMVGQRDPPRSVPVVLSRDGRIAATASPRPAAMVTLKLRPGRYRVDVLARRLCTSEASISTAPLQSLVIRCRP